MSFTGKFVSLLREEFAGIYLDDLRSLLGFPMIPDLPDLVSFLVRSHFHQGISEATFVDKSVGLVVGLELQSGEQVVLKLFHPSQAVSELEASHRVLAVLFDAGFPCPKPLTGIFPATDRLTGCFYEFSSGQQKTGHEPGVAEALAEALANFSGLVRRVPTDGLALAPGHQPALWRGSHRSFLRHEANEATRQIDEVGKRAQVVLQTSRLPQLPAHMDWGVKNARFNDDLSVTVVYDWDSLARASEAEMVGRAAAQFTAQWSLPGEIVPSAEEALRFVKTYEQAVGRSFSSEEWPVLRAAAEYLTAEVARHEALSPEPPQDAFLARLQRLDDSPIFEEIELHDLGSPRSR